MSDTPVRTLKDLPSQHLLGAGTSLCAGCGGLEALHEIYDLVGGKSVIVNAAGCMSLLSIYPFTPFRGGWLYTAMASAPAGAQGVRDALDILIAKRRLPKEEDLEVVVLAGDGSSAGMGLSATSAAIQRGLDFLYLCYDNEGYGNTGQQSSEMTPLGAHTATSGGSLGWPARKKDLFAIWTAHRPAYAATAIAAEPLDLARKIATAIELEGPRLVLVLAPCPTGWDFDPSETVEIGRLAVRTGVFPLLEYRDGEVKRTRVPQPRAPVEEYLRRQGRFRHLFEPARNEEVLRAIQAQVDADWRAHE